MKWPIHGSNPQYLFSALQLPLPNEPLDFSANINPLGPPPILREKWEQLFEVVSDYPDPEGQQLKKKLAEKEHILENQILIGNGGAELISLIGRLLAGKRVVIVQPAFSEYEEACQINSCQIEYVQLTGPTWELDLKVLSEKLIDADALFLCNPCNPTGVYYDKSTLVHLMKETQRQQCLFIIDEAFYDFVTDYESIVHCLNDFENLLIIRSMTKMFAIPGLRLGYLLANEKIIEQFSSYQPQWSMNALALKAGEWCLESKSFIEDTRALIEAEREKLFSFYQENGFAVSPSRVNFYLLKDPTRKEQLPLFQFLLDRGIIPRHTMNFPGLEGEWLRFAIKSPKHNEKLMEAMKEWRNQ